MMRTRFLALFHPEKALSDEYLQNLCHRIPDRMAPIINTHRLQIWATNGAIIADGAVAAAILGPLYDRGNSVASKTLSGIEWAATILHRGEHLIQRYWGNYIAIIDHGNELDVIRAPFGDTACFHMKTPTGYLFASDMELLSLVAPGSFSSSTSDLVRHIGWPDIRSSRTCLSGIGELRGGDRISVTDRGRIQTVSLWVPWNFVSPERCIIDIGEAVRALKGAVRATTKALTAAWDNPLLMLSGGLDSSVIAACLAESRQGLTALNLLPGEAAGDELAYAHQVADLHNIHLITASMDPTRVDVEKSEAANMPWPAERGWTQEVHRHARNAMEQTGCDCLIDGGGGDNVFFAILSIAILADYLRSNSYDRQFRCLCRILGEMGQRSPLKLIFQAGHRAWFRPPAPRRPAPNIFLSEDIRKALMSDPVHPWHKPPPGTLPGKAVHVSLLIPAQNMIEAINALSHAPMISPLVSQPVVEICLRIVSWLWISPNKDRAVARQAFQPLLPAAVINRRAKGSPDFFVAQVFEHNRSIIRDMLLGGEISSLGILNNRQIQDYLGRSGPVRNIDFARLMELVDVEAWLQTRRY